MQYSNNDIHVIHTYYIVVVVTRKSVTHTTLHALPGANVYILTVYM